MSLLSATLGRLLPGYKTVNQWAVIYSQIIDGRPICQKTRANRRGALKHVLANLGGRTISSVRPHEVSAMIQCIAALHPQTAKRVLFEVEDLFNEAVNYGWIDRNPAGSVKAPVCRIQRKRLTLEQWCAIQGYAVEHMQPWVSRMLIGSDYRATPQRPVQDAFLGCVGRAPAHRAGQDGNPIGIASGPAPGRNRPDTWRGH